MCAVVCVVIVIPWETVSQPISTTTADCLPGLTSSDCACLGSLVCPSVRLFVRPSVCLPVRRPALRALTVAERQPSEHMPSIHNKMFAFQFICMWPGIWTRSDSVRLVLASVCHVPFAFAFTLAVAYGTLIIVESSSHSIFVVFHLCLSVCLAFVFGCMYFFNALWIIDWDRGLRGPSITLFVYMIILDCPLRPLRPLGFGICRWLYFLFASFAFRFELMYACIYGLCLEYYHFYHL